MKSVTPSIEGLYDLYLRWDAMGGGGMSWDGIV